MAGEPAIGNTALLVQIDHGVVTCFVTAIY
jgi:hypothetical protein